MKRDYKISVAIATYNGEQYIKEQLFSILVNLGDNDEIIISDDGSTDSTLKIIKSLNDKRIKIINGPQKGVKQNFANAISHTNGKYIFLADQDDIWDSHKVFEVLSTFEKEDCTCVTHNNDVVNGDATEVIISSFFEHRKSKAGVFYNIYKNRYLGCCMAFREDMKKYILPIPDDIEMHDQWIGVICDIHGKSIFLDKKLIHYRRHGGNVSDMNHYPILKMIRNRLVFVKAFLKRI